MIFDHTFEIEIEAGLLEFEVTCKAYPGEPMVMYYPDGSGYPGSPPEVETLELRVICLSTEDEELDALELAERGLIQDLASQAWDNIDYDELLEIANEQDASY